MTTSTQVAVIGAGPGGYAAAFLAADMGIQVTLIDEEPDPGGVCLYRGCIPSKALLHVAKVMGEARHAANWGIQFGEPSIDVAKLAAWKAGVVKRLTAGLGQLSKQRKVEYVRGRAAFVDAHTLTVKLDKGDERQVTFEHAIVATGSQLVCLPGWPESDRILDSTSALEVKDVPKRLLVVGGGYIGLELGTVYAALGSQLTVVEMTSGLLPGVDRDLVDVLSKRVTGFAESVMLDTKVTDVSEEIKGVRVTFEGRSGRADQVFDAVLVAIGRRPNSKIEGLERTKIELDTRGFIKVDGQRRTREPSIYAIGDVVGEPMLAHKASHEGRVAVEVIAGRNVSFDPLAIPAVVFTDPEVAWCGLTETQAKADGREVRIAKFPWTASGRAITLDRPEGVTKLVIDPETERILGVGIVGSGAGELIAEGVVAVEMSALVSDLRLCIHPHPTLSETLMEAAEGFFGTATHFRARKAK